MPYKRILQPGRNCWRIRRAERLAFLIDGKAYFDALYDALNQAQRDIMILSWDVYSDLRLGALKGDKRSLADLLDQLLNDNPELGAHILNWDFAVLFAMSREWLPIYKLGWKTHPRLVFQMDDQHPLGASHHQKVIIVDRRLAFAGGLDITRGRWDTPEHRAHDPRREQVDDTRGRPYHDVQMAVSGEVADALHDMARERWRRATDEPIRQPQTGDHNPWPEQVAVDLENVDVAISRTMPAYQDYREIREVEQLYLDAIAAARNYIYMENQYFTSPTISRALAERLQEKHGPEIILNLPLETEGWLAQNSMDVIRVKLLKSLRNADPHGRLAIYYPYKDDLETMPINLHAKIMVVDDRFVRVGSSNLNNRSMGLDTECDLSVECLPDEAHIKQGIVAFRNRLLAEHLGREQTQVEAACEQHDSLIAAIEAERLNQQRCLMPLEEKLPRHADSVLTESELVDPEQPVNLDSLLYHVVPEKQTPNVARRVIGWLISLILLLGLAAAWRYTPLAQWLDLSQVTSTIDNLRNSALAPLLLVAAFILAGLLMVPVTLLIIASVIVFGPFAGATYGMAGAVGCALSGYWLGSLLGRDAIKNLAGGRISRISQQLARRGVFTMIFVRIVPVAPFTVLNLVAGASHIKLRDFFWGTLLGLLPGVTAIALLTDRVRASMDNPQADTIALVVGLALVILVAGYILSRHLLTLRES